MNNGGDRPRSEARAWTTCVPGIVLGALVRPNSVLGWIILAVVTLPGVVAAIKLDEYLLKARRRREMEARAWAMWAPGITLGALVRPDSVLGWIILAVVALPVTVAAIKLDEYLLKARYLREADFNL